MTDTLYAAEIEVLQSLDFATQCDMCAGDERCPNDAVYLAEVHASSRTGRWEGCRRVTVPICQDCVDRRLNIPLPTNCSRCHTEITVRRDWIANINPL